MKIAITTQGKDLDSQLDPRFGRAKSLLVVDTETNQFQAYDNTVNLNASSGAGIQTAQNIANHDVEAVITSNIGPNAVKTLNAASVLVYLADQSQSAKQALQDFKSGDLEQISESNVEGHWV